MMLIKEGQKHTQRGARMGCASSSFEYIQMMCVFGSGNSSNRSSVMFWNTNVYLADLSARVFCSYRRSTQGNKDRIIWDPEVPHCTSGISSWLRVLIPHPWDTVDIRYRNQRHQQVALALDHIIFFRPISLT